MRRRKGFTLLEIIIVVIIIGILAGLALPRIFRTVEFSRAAEALATLGTIKQAMARCFVYANTYAGCDNFATLDIEDPNTVPGHLFTYGIVVVPPNNFTITATRNGIPANTITLDQAGTKVGAGDYASIR